MHIVHRILVSLATASAALPLFGTVIFAQAPNPHNLTPTTDDCPAPAPVPRALLAGDSWAQYMWDDGTHNEVFDKFGHADKSMISRSTADHPGPDLSAKEYAVSGSEAREFVDTDHYPFLQNMLEDLIGNPTIDTVVLSIGGNDVLAGKSDGGWYKDMDIDPDGIQTEAEFFDSLEADSYTITDAILAVRPELKVMISGYDYPNFDIGWLCELYDFACAKREDLSLDPINDLITDQEINAMMIGVENRRVGWANANNRLYYDHSLGLMHHFYGDGDAGPNILPHPGQLPPDYSPFPGGNPQLPSLRSTFRNPFDPIHLSADGYEYKITTETLNYFLPLFRGSPKLTLTSQGGTQDGWSNGATVGTDSVYLGDDGSLAYAGILSFDTAGIPERAIFTDASLYLVREAGIGTNPFQSGALGSPTLDIALGSFGNPQVEASDLTAPADSTDVGCIYGSAKDSYYAVRADITSTGLTAINKEGLTQFRLAFPGSDVGSSDRVEFYTGDGVLPAQAQRMKSKIITFEEPLPNGTTYKVSETITAIDHAGLAEFRESVSPFLDIDYCLAPDATTVSISQNEGTLSLTWPPAADAIAYEVWTDGGKPLFRARRQL